MEIMLMCLHWSEMIVGPIYRLILATNRPISFLFTSSAKGVNRRNLMGKCITVIQISFYLRNFLVKHLLKFGRYIARMIINRILEEKVGVIDLFFEISLIFYMRTIDIRLIQVGFLLFLSLFTP